MASYWVLTTAHCVKNASSIRLIRAWIGYQDLRDIPDPSMGGENTDVAKTEGLFHITERIIHENYSYIPPDINAYDDIALLKLSKSAKFGPNVQPVCLPRRKYRDDYGKLVAITWGLRESSSDPTASSKLQQTILDYVRNETCVQEYRKVMKGTVKYLVDSRNMCTLNETAGACIVDSGSPLITYEVGSMLEFFRARAFVVGLNTWGGQCDGYPGHPEVAFRISHYVDWILHSTNKEICYDY